MTPEELRLVRFDRLGLFQKHTTIEDVLARTVGLQAQVIRQAEVNIGLRTADTKLKDLQHLYEQRAVVRTWAQRWTFQLMLQQDFELVIAARQDERLPNNYYLGEKALILHLAEVLETYLTSHEAVSQAEVEALLSDEANKPVAGQLGYAVLQTVVSHGKAYFDLTSTDSGYVMHVATPSLLSVEEAIKSLIMRYLDGFGPVTMADFVKWSGIRPKIARSIWNEVTKDLQQVKVLDQTLVSDKSVNVQMLQDQIAQSAILTAGFDASMTGYVDKDWLVTPEHQSDLWSKNGILRPYLMIDGEIVAIWSLKTTSQGLNFTVDNWQKLTKVCQKQATQEFERIADFLEKPLQAITF